MDMLVSIDESVLEGVNGGGNGFTLSLPNLGELLHGGANASFSGAASGSVSVNLLGLLGISFGFSTSASAGVGVNVGAAA